MSSPGYIYQYSEGYLTKANLNKIFSFSIRTLLLIYPLNARLNQLIATPLIKEVLNHALCKRYFFIFALLAGYAGLPSYISLMLVMRNKYLSFRKAVKLKIEAIHCSRIKNSDMNIMPLYTGVCVPQDRSMIK